MSHDSQSGAKHPDARYRHGRLPSRFFINGVQLAFLLRKWEKADIRRDVFVMKQKTQIQTCAQSKLEIINVLVE